MLPFIGCHPKLSIIFKIGFLKFINYLFYFLKAGNRTFHNVFIQPALRVPGFFSILTVGIVPDTDCAWDDISSVWLPLWQKAKQKESLRLQNFLQDEKALQLAESCLQPKVLSHINEWQNPKNSDWFKPEWFHPKQNVTQVLTCQIYFSIYRDITLRS